MIRINWHQNSKKIVKHFRSNVFLSTVGPHFDEWLREETGGIIVYAQGAPIELEFANEQDYVMFLLKWGG